MSHEIDEDLAVKKLRQLGFAVVKHGDDPNVDYCERCGCGWDRRTRSGCFVLTCGGDPLEHQRRGSLVSRDHGHPAPYSDLYMSELMSRAACRMAERGQAQSMVDAAEAWACHFAALDASGGC